jgi:FkbM family methyltransferase
VKAQLTEIERHRIATTVALRDTDVIPKVPGAGDVVDHDGQAVQIMHNGLLIEEGCYYGHWMTEVIKELRGHHEPQEEVVFQAIMDRLAADAPAQAAMIELGSYWAYYSLWLRKVLPSATSVIVEPDPLNLEVGRRNFALNGMQATAVHAAVALPHGGSVDLISDNDGISRRTPVVTVDGLMADHGLARCDLLLCDIQGFELDMLTGAAAALRDGRLRFLVVSTHHHSISGDPLTHQKCLAELQRLGAHIIAEHSVYESCSGDGLIAASMDPRDAGFVVDVPVVRNRDSVFGEPEFELAAMVGWKPAVQRSAARMRAAGGRMRHRLRPGG